MRSSGEKDSAVPVELHKTSAYRVQPFNGGEGNKTVRACYDDSIYRAIGAAKPGRHHALLDRERSPAVIAWNRYGTIRDYKTPAIDPDAGIVSGDRQHPVFDATDSLRISRSAARVSRRR